MASTAAAAATPHDTARAVARPEAEAAAAAAALPSERLLTAALAMPAAAGPSLPAKAERSKTTGGGEQTGQAAAVPTAAHGDGGRRRAIVAMEDAGQVSAWPFFFADMIPTLKPELCAP